MIGLMIALIIGSIINSLTDSMKCQSVALFDSVLSYLLIK